VAPPTNTVAPKILGKPTEGNVLRADPGKWQGSKPIRYAFLWRRCDTAGERCEDVAMATDRIYPLEADDVGATLRVQVIATADGRDAPAVSEQTDVVAKAPEQAPRNTAPPAITGTPETGKPLTATAGTWTGAAPVRLRIRWRRCDDQGGACVSLKATGAKYTPRARDVGGTLRILVEARNRIATASALSLPTRIVGRPEAAKRPELVSPPRITGAAQLGKTVTASSGTWRGTQPIAFSFQWLRCAKNGGACGRIAGGRRQTHLIVAGDRGRTLRVRVTAQNSAGSRSATSGATSVVVGGTAPANSAAPAISGSNRQGSTLTASTGSWSGTPPISFSFQWQRCGTGGGACTGIGGATSQAYTLAAADVGRTIRVRVTARNDVGRASAVSGATAVVAAPAPTGSAPANTSRPALSGTTKQGQTLVLSNGGWNGTPPLRFGYGWQRCDANGNNCSTIGGVHGNRYRLTPADVARRVRGIVTAANALGSTTATTAPSGVVTGPPVVTSLPTIAGASRAGSTLTAGPGSWRSVSTMSFTFQWKRCTAAGQSCTAVTGASAGRTYALTGADVGHRLVVTVKASNASGSSGATSGPTALIAAAPAPPSTPTPPSASVAVANVALPDRLIVDRVKFTPTRIRSRTQPLVLRVHVSEVRSGRPVAGALVHAVGVPFNRLSRAPEVRTGTNGWATISFRVKPTFKLRRGNYLVVFVRARKPGGSILAGVSIRRLVSVRIG
jgi:hypothetical protein